MILQNYEIIYFLKDFMICVIIYVKIEILYFQSDNKLQEF